MECVRYFTEPLLSPQIVQAGWIPSSALGWLRINSNGACEGLNLAWNLKLKQFLRDVPKRKFPLRSLWYLKAVEHGDPKMADPFSSENEAELDEIAIEIDSSFKQNVASVEDWRKALNKVIPAVVVLKITACRAFDTESPGASSATGFVVDKRRGVILTNRHVVKPGPVIAEAVFLNREEVPVRPLYRDPVHDFGFFHYDLGAIKSLDYDEIPLAPEAACVGLEIRVVGNDSGEKVSILSGTLARLDRDAPHYKKDGYNDFNVFYMQAASGTKGGSSGSPVIDCLGRAVALNAGGRSSGASAFFLPLERVVRALHFIQEKIDRNIYDWDAVSIPRGTLQVSFLHKGFDEIRRLGLQSETEKMVRHASSQGETGMLVVDSLVPGGPGYGHLQPGDILVRANQEVITHFLNLEILLDDNVNQKIELQIERGGTSLTIYLLVQNLHSVTPRYFLEVGGAVIHPLSYQQARNFHFQCGLVYVAEPGYMLSRAGVPKYAIVKKFAGEDVSSVEDFIAVLSKLSKGARVPLEFLNYKDRHRIKYALVTVDQHEWYAPPLIYTRNDNTGLWNVKLAFNSYHLSHTHDGNDFGGFAEKTFRHANEASKEHDHLDNCEELIEGIDNLKMSYEDVSEVASIHSEAYSGEEKHIIEENMLTDRRTIASLSSDITSEAEEENPNGLPHSIAIDHQCSTAAEASASSPELVIEPALVMCEVHVPPSCMLDGVHSLHSSGTGVIVYHNEDMGLVVVDQNRVAISAVDVMLSFAAFPMEIPGKVIFLHPTHNYALIAYEPSALGPIGVSAVRAAELFPEPSLNRGDSVYFVGLSRNLQITSRKSTVTNPCASVKVGSGEYPRGRPTLMEVIELDTDFGPALSGVLSDEQGRIRALWGNFSIQQKTGSNRSKIHQYVRGIPIYTISEVLDKIIAGANGPSLFINGTKRSMPLVRVLEAEFYPRLLSKARSFGLSDNWIQVLVKKDPVRRQVLRVKGCFAGSAAENSLEQGDMVLAIDKEPVTRLRDIEKALRRLDKLDSHDGKLNMTIFRQGREVDVLVGTDIKDGNGTTRAVSWCGCIVQDPHPSVRALGFLPEEGHGVYVTRCWSGSPVHRYGLHALRWIVEVNGKPTPDLDTFVDVIKELEHGQFVRVKTINLNAKPRVLTLKQDLHYWPTWELKFNPNTAVWHRKIINSLECGSM